MSIPTYWLTRPEYAVDLHQEHFQRSLKAGLETGIAEPLPVDVPVWAFLCWLCDKRGYVAHGTGQDDISLFEPRQSNDVGWFGNRQAVYASSDALWAMFYAVMNRQEVAMTISNAAIHVYRGDRLEPLYFFGVSRHAVEQRAFRNGWVYFLASTGFERQQGGESGEWRYESCQCANLEPVKPEFRVAVRPEDFPFLESIHAFDDAVLAARVEKNPDGFPWLEN